jgi:hypothetical protein
MMSVIIIRVPPAVKVEGGFSTGSIATLFIIANTRNKQSIIE